MRAITSEIGQLSAHDLIGELQNIAASISTIDDQARDRIRRCLTALHRRMSPLSVLKTGTEMLKEDTRALLFEVLDEFNAMGLFLVPCGEIEQWLPGKVKASKDKKALWAIEAAAYIESNQPCTDDIWLFATKVSSYIVERLKRR
jgi:hypothetical protein